MPAAVKAGPAVNQLLLNDWEAAVALGGMLLAIPALKYRTIMDHLGFSKDDLSKPENLEIDLLDEQAVDGFQHESVSHIYHSAIAAKMRGAKSLWRWDRGLWKNTHSLTANGTEVTTMLTPMLDEETGQLVYWSE